MSCQTATWRKAPIAQISTEDIPLHNTGIVVETVLRNALYQLTVIIIIIIIIIDIIHYGPALR